MKRRHLRENRRAFTMVELMAVLVIVGLLFAVAAGNLMGQADKARVTTTKASLKILHQAVLQYKMDTGQYPTEEEGLMVLIERPMDVNSWDPAGYLESTELPVDGWGNDFVYRLNPPSEKPFDVVSYGANGEDDGELYDDDEDAKNYDKDLSSTDAN